MIEVSNLTKRYGKFKAVDDVSFTIEKGHIYGLLGPNGAGKSTTMNIITGYLASTSGKVTVDGHDVIKEPEKSRKMIGYLPELPPLYMDMTVYEYLKFAAELKKVKRSERIAQVEDVMEQMKITNMADRLIANLSKGYRQRVGFAQALLGNPEILILDEPSVGLDPKQIIEMRELITELGKNRTVILSSHIMQEISAVCDHILIICHGKLIASGTIDELKNMSEHGPKLCVTIEGSKGLLKQALEEFDEIESVDITSEGKMATADAVLKKNSKDIRKDIYKFLSDKDAYIINMNLSEVTLEEVFLELTTKNDIKEEKELEENITEDDSLEETSDAEIYEVEDNNEGKED